MLRTLANVMKLSGCDVPDWMLAMKPMAYVVSVLACAMRTQMAYVYVSLVSLNLARFRVVCVPCVLVDRRSRRKQLEKIPLKRHRISTVSKFDRQQAARKK